MKKLILLLTLFALPSSLWATPGDPLFDDSEILKVRYPTWFKDSFLDLGEDLNEAAGAGKQGLMLYFSTTGCSYCVRFLERSLGDPLIAARLRRDFDVIGLEIFDDREMNAPDGEPMRVKDFAARMQAEFSPTLVFIDRDGNLLLRIVGYYSPARFVRVLDYLGDAAHRQLSFRDYEAGLSPQGAKSPNALFHNEMFPAPPYMLDRSRIPAQRPLLVLFEAADCADCAQFHEQVLQDRELWPLLEGFDLVQLNVNDDESPLLSPEGRRTTPARWARDLSLSGVPALVFFDRDGRQVLKTDALVLRQRMKNSLNFVLDKAYEQGMTYQRYARTRALEKSAAASSDGKSVKPAHP